MRTHPGTEGPIAAIPGTIFSGAFDGMLRALDAATGKVIWEYNTARDFETVNGVPAKGGSMGAPGPIITSDALLVTSGYVGVKNGAPGNVLLVFGLPAR
jgi:polyvinyl alcohol dehydrogenase (cytochrome)